MQRIAISYADLEAASARIELLTGSDVSDMETSLSGAADAADNITMASVEVSPAQGCVSTFREELDSLNGRIKDLLDAAQQWDSNAASLFDDICLGLDVRFDAGGNIQPAVLGAIAYNLQKPDRMAFLDIIQEQFGFDYYTSLLICKVLEGVKASNPDASQRELDWMFTRALSQLRYNKGEYVAAQWRAGAGYVYEYDREDAQEYFLNLGLTEPEFNWLFYKVRIQNAIVSNPEGHAYELYDERNNKIEEFNEWKRHMEESFGRALTDSEFDKFWRRQYDEFCVKQPDGSYRGKTDFAHMMYIIAGSCVDDKADGVINWTGVYWNDSDTRKQYVGWLGDATNRDIVTAEVSFGGDDYSADLDADNIRRRMESQNKPFMQASLEYFETLKDNPQQRTLEFKRNNSIEDVEKAVIKAARVKTVDELIDKKGWSGSYNFLMCLQNDDVEIKNYHE